MSNLQVSIHYRQKHWAGAHLRLPVSWKHHPERMFFIWSINSAATSRVDNDWLSVCLLASACLCVASLLMLFFIWEQWDPLNRTKISVERHSVFFPAHCWWHSLSCSLRSVFWRRIKTASEIFKCFQLVLDDCLDLFLEEYSQINIIWCIMSSKYQFEP